MAGWLAFDSSFSSLVSAFSPPTVVSKTVPAPKSTTRPEYRVLKGPAQYLLYTYCWPASYQLILPTESYIFIAWWKRFMLAERTRSFLFTSPNAYSRVLKYLLQDKTAELLARRWGQVVADTTSVFRNPQFQNVHYQVSGPPFDAEVSQLPVASLKPQDQPSTKAHNKRSFLTKRDQITHVNTKLGI
ncbi:uncharacterized protein BT62DRAFT_216572 [Guyanagaster necrorhizus]|uniref:Uncharacterized protein n=1 Tax=Guyanagaster necrorhizus TaxID=856835 RepID=A0A9P8AS90_9AGAR|nr:uncharacterized protein BT62DRAFT_216572 [Guyanagaster necrorhizus MCA 3950]KAG7444622.1 hypothetical protein BT62DRAFT_216572 [Guyanagaster necrorhizus MCA 3950]